MGSLGFLTPFQFYASDSVADKCHSSAGSETENKLLSRVPVYRSAVDKVLRGKCLNLGWR